MDRGSIMDNLPFASHFNVHGLGHARLAHVIEVHVNAYSNVKQNHVWREM